MTTAPEEMVGRVLTGVSSSWHEFEGRRSAEPVHVWLSLAGRGKLRLHTLNGLVIASAEVDVPYDMGEHGRLVVEESGPAALVKHIGERVVAVSRLTQSPPGASVGVVLRFESGSVGVADLGDDLVVATWPADDWAQCNVAITPVG